MNRRTVLLVLAAVIAAVGAGLVFAYVQNAEERAQDQYETVDVLTAVEPIAPGESIKTAAQAGKLELQPVPQTQLLDGYQTSLEGIAEKVALTKFYPGEQIIASKVGTGSDVKVTSALPIPKGKIAITVNLSDVARVAGFVQPGSQVAIFYTGPGADGGKLTRVLLSPVTVIGIGSTTPGSQAQGDNQANTGEVPRALVTLAVSKAQAERIIFASSEGELAFGLLTESSKIPAGDGIQREDLFG